LGTAALFRDGCFPFLDTCLNVPYNCFVIGITVGGHMEIRPAETKAFSPIIPSKASDPKPVDEQNPDAGPIDTHTSSPNQPSTAIDTSSAASILAKTVSIPPLLWSTKAGLWITSLVIGDSNKLYAGFEGGVIALSMDEGKTGEKFSIDGGCAQEPALGDGGKTLFLGTNQGSPDRMYAYDAGSGSSKWSKDMRAGTFCENAVTGPDGIFYVGESAYHRSGADNRIVAINGISGEIVWQFKTGGRLQSRPLLTSDGALIACSKDHKIYSLDGLTGKKRWDFDIGASLACDPAHGPDGSVICVSEDGDLYALDELSGKKRWSTSTGEKGKYTSGALVCGPDGTVYLISSSTEGEFRAFDGRTGALRWEDFSEKWVQAPPVVDARGTLYLAIKDQQKIALYDAKSGKVTGEIKLDAQPDVLVLDVKEERLYCGTSDGNVLAFSVAPADVRMKRGLEAPAVKNKPEVVVQEDRVIIDDLTLEKKK